MIQSLLYMIKKDIEQSFLERPDSVSPDLEPFVDHIITRDILDNQMAEQIEALLYRKYTLLYRSILKDALIGNKVARELVHQIDGIAETIEIIGDIDGGSRIKLLKQSTLEKAFEDMNH